MRRFSATMLIIAALAFSQIVGAWGEFHAASAMQTAGHSHTGAGHDHSAPDPAGNGSDGGPCVHSICAPTFVTQRGVAEISPAPIHSALWIPADDTLAKSAAVRKDPPVPRRAV